MDQLKQHLNHTSQYPTMSPYDPEPIIKCKGTCVGHTGPVWCLAANNDFLFSGSSDNHVKVRAFSYFPAFPSPHPPVFPINMSLLFTIPASVCSN